jgi:hypothetical protein
MPGSLFLPYKAVFRCPEVEPFLVKIMAVRSNSMRLDDEICDELWNEDEFSSEFSDDSHCDGDVVVTFLSDSEQSDSSEDEDNVDNDSGMQHGTWTKVGAELS